MMPARLHSEYVSPINMSSNTINNKKLYTTMPFYQGIEQLTF